MHTKQPCAALYITLLVTSELDSDLTTVKHHIYECKTKMQDYTKANKDMHQLVVTWLLFNKHKSGLISWISRFLLKQLWFLYILLTLKCLCIIQTHQFIYFCIYIYLLTPGWNLFYVEILRGCKSVKPHWFQQILAAGGTAMYQQRFWPIRFILPLNK